MFSSITKHMIIGINIAQTIKRQAFTLLFISVATLFFIICLDHSYLLFHVFIELFSVVIAFSLFTVTWNSRKVIDNQYLFLIGTVALFIGILDTFHIVTYQGMNIIQSPIFYANQFWIATRFLESIAMLIGFAFLKGSIKLRGDILLSIFTVISALIILSILYWEIFPVCYIKDVGQTKFKIYSEYVIISILILSLIFLVKNKSFFEHNVFRLLIGSIVFAIVTEFCFTLYVSNFSFSNQLGHFTKLLTFYLIYKANIETGFVKPTETIFKNLKDSEDRFRMQSIELAELNKNYIAINEILNCNVKEVDSLNDTLILKNETLRELNATKDTFFRIIAHDLKGPFSSILGISKLLLNSIDIYNKERIRVIADLINQSSINTYNLLENLLEWSRSQSGELTIKHENLVLRNLADDIVSLNKNRALEKGISIINNVPENATMDADKNMLNTVLRNLVSNALKFTHSNGYIIIGAKELNNVMQVSVSDTGVGMDVDAQNKLFKITEKVSTLGTENETGTGLGLILCKEFVEKHHGTIWVESELGKGSVFTFTIPKQMDPLSQAQPSN